MLHQIDLFLGGFVVISAIVGLARGLSGELISILKLLLTVILSQQLSAIIHQKFAIAAILNVILPSLLFGMIYFFLSIVSGIFLIPIRNLIDAIIPAIINKPLGLVIGSIKSVFIIIVAYNLYVITINNFNFSSDNYFHNSIFADDLIATEEPAKSFLAGYINNKLDNSQDNDDKKNLINEFLNNSGDETKTTEIDKSEQEAEQKAVGENIETEDTENDANYLDDLETIIKIYDKINDTSTETDPAENISNDNSKNSNSNDSNSGSPSILNNLNKVMQLLEQ